MGLDLFVLGEIVLLGLVAGILGGMLGVGGSTIMIPGLVLLFGQRPDWNQHLYQAAAMIVNVFVSVPAALRHHRAGEMSPRALKLIFPAAVIAVVGGVFLSNLSFFSVGASEAGATGSASAEGPRLLGRIMAVFLLYVIVANLRQLFGRDSREGPDPVAASLTPLRCGTVGTGMGLLAGLLGIGGGSVAVPLQQVLLKLRLRSCIANSSALICVTALLGASYKNATLPTLGLPIARSLGIAGLLAPTALVGGYLGAKLTHRFPIRLVRACFVALMVVAAAKMAELF